MRTLDIIETNEGQEIHLPSDFHFATTKVSIRREGDAIILEPVKPAQWPQDFFAKIAIDDKAFVRPPQGDMPPAPSLELPE